MHVGGISPAVIFPLSPDEKGSPGYLRGGDYSAAALGDDGATAWMSSQWSGGTGGAKSCYAKFDSVLGGQGASSCPSWGTWVSRAKVEVGGASAAERVAEARRKAAAAGGGGGGAPAVGPAGAPPASSSSFAPSPSGAPPASAESYGDAADSWVVVVAKEAAPPVNRPSVEEKEGGGKERKEEEKEREEERERDREEKNKEKNEEERD